MKLADLQAELTDLNAEIRILATRCEKDSATDADLSELEAAMARKTELSAQIDEAKARQDLIRNAKAASAAVTTIDPVATHGAADPVVTNVRDRREDDPQAGFKSGKDFFAAVMNAETAMLRGRDYDERLKPLAAVGSDEQRGNSDPDGGFLIPEGFSPNLLQVDFEGDPTTGRTTMIPMSSPSIAIPARTDKSHATSVTGGFRFYRGNQATEAVSSKTQTELVKLEANGLTGLAFATDDLINDSPISVAAIISNGFRTEYGATMLEEKIRGTGVGQYEGVLNSPAKITAAAVASQGAGTIVGKNIVQMRAHCWGYSNAIWLANHDTIPQLMAAHIPGTNGDVSVWAPSLQDDKPEMLLGRPIFFTEFCEALGAEGDLILFNPTQYLEGMLQGLQEATSMHVRFTANEQCFRIKARNDGKCWWRSAITPRKGANSLSPIVTLNGTRA